MNICNRFRYILLILLFVFFNSSVSIQGSNTYYNNSDYYVVKKTNDFIVNGIGDNSNWNNAEWIKLNKREDNEDLSNETYVKMIYSKTGLYFLFYCEDSLITSTMDADFLDLWNEDVVEVFLWTDENYPVYFEYELSPLNHELPLIISNTKGVLNRWQPFHYEEDRRAMHETSVIGGNKQSFSKIEAWIAEFFIPYKLLIPLNNVPPKPGDKWRANFYRLDYDLDESVSWLWKLTEKNFHDYKSFGTIIFD